MVNRCVRCASQAFWTKQACGFTYETCNNYVSVLMLVHKRLDLSVVIFYQNVGEKSRSD